MQELLGYASGLLITISAVPYISEIFRLKTKPERATWLIWSVLLTIAFCAQFAKGGTWSLITTGIDCLIVIIIFALSIKYGMGGASRLDIFALVASGVGLVLWHLTNEPLYALLITIVIDMLASMLTVVKTYKEPSTETFSAYMICGTGGLLGAFAVGTLNFSLIIFPLWICVMNYGIGFTIWLGQQRQSQ